MAEDNVKVAVRVRPLLQREKLAGDQPCLRIIQANNQLVLGKDRAFTFDHVINSKFSQEDMFTCVMPTLISSCFEGYNATVFAYGQTGSGKTYTIGSGHIGTVTEEEYGIIPRSIQEMFAHMKKHEEIQFTVKVSFMEIYKEELQDLLDFDETSTKDIHIREDEKGNTVVIGVNEYECQSAEEVMSCLVTGSSLRHTGSTQMNEHSSRSHSIFTMLIEQRWSDGEKKPNDADEDDNFDDNDHYMCSKFHFVDLAGSERAHRTGNVGDRFKESIHINTGLLALGNVISALGDPKKKVSHIPYRDAKITRILKDSLGGNAKTLMICCISPASTSFDESLNSLKYANRARNIRNKPIVNRDPQSVRFEEMQIEIRALREELAKQRTSLYTAGSETQDNSQVKALEEQIAKLQTECSHYQLVAEEAYKQLTDILNRELLTKSQTCRLSDWMDLMEEIKNKVPKTFDREQCENQTIMKLNDQLRKCQEDLKSDEKIFAERTKETNDLRDHIQMLEAERSDNRHQLTEALDKLHKQSQLLVEQQLRIDGMEKNLKERHVSLGCSTDIDLEQSSYAQQRRAKSVPASKINRQNSNEVRKIHTSPALISLDRVLQSFRARSQLLVNQLDDEDFVRQQTFDSDGDDRSQPFERRLTYKVSAKKRHRSNQQESNTKNVGEDVVDSDVWETRASQLDIKNKSSSMTDLQKRKIKESQLKLQNANQKMRDLAINIRLKEQLIRELVKTSKESETVNKQYAHRIKKLEKEHEAATVELHDMQKAMNELEHKEQHEVSEKRKLQSEFQKKIDAAKTRMQVVQRKQRDTEKIASFADQNTKKIHGLEHAVDRMKQQQESLQRKLKEETERKAKLEREMQKEQQKTKELEIKNEQQQKILKRKTEEIAAVQRRLRSGSSSTAVGQQEAQEVKHIREEQERLEDQKRWLDSEVEKVLSQRHQIDSLQEDLHRREEIIVKKEAMLAEKSSLEIKRLRSSQVLNHDIVTVDKKLQQVEKKLEEKSNIVADSTEDQQVALREEMKALSFGKDKLHKQRHILEEKLHAGAILSPQEERRLIELDEAVEALDAAIEFKNDSILHIKDDIRRSQILSQSEDNMMGRLQMLQLGDAKVLLTKYFEKVIDLRDAERQSELHCSELEVKIDEQERLIQEMENSLEHNVLDLDRRLTQQQQEYELKIQVLMKQLSDTDPSKAETSVALEAKVQQLEKDLYYYKKTSRDLKRKMRELMTHIGAQEGMGDLISPGTPREDGGDTCRTPRSVREGKLNSARSMLGEDEDKLTPMRISRKDLRQMSEDEVQLRKSNITSVSVQDSLEADAELKNPWS